MVCGTLFNKDSREIQLSNVVWDIEKGILGYVVQTVEAMVIEKLSQSGMFGKYVYS